MDAPQPLVLVVDDNEMNRDMLGRRLQRQHIAVVTADSGTAALDIVRARPIDLVLLDVMMPGVSGYDVLATMKADPQLRHIPVIMVSAVDDIDSVVRCLELGAEDYLFKPFNPVLLKARVGASLVRRAGSRLTTIAEHLRDAKAAIAVVRAGAVSVEQASAASAALQHLECIESLLTQEASA